MTSSPVGANVPVRFIEFAQAVHEIPRYNKICSDRMNGRTDGRTDGQGQTAEDCMSRRCANLLLAFTHVLNNS